MHTLEKRQFLWAVKPFFWDNNEKYYNCLRFFLLIKKNKTKKKKKKKKNKISPVIQTVSHEDNLLKMSQPVFLEK